MPGRIELIGVYQLPVTEDLFAAQAELLYGANASLNQRAQLRHQLESAVLVEVLVSDADDDFDVADFIQENPRLPRANWQAAWAEAFLSVDGQQLLVERWDPLPPLHAHFRVAFFIHEWQVGRRLLTSYGELPGASPTAMPDRLLQLVPYELVD
jgi:hypothetical protein